MSPSGAVASENIDRSGIGNTIVRSRDIGMKLRGWVRSEWRVTENHRRARYYELTRAGEEQLVRERSQWKRASDAVNGILNWVEGPA